MMHPFHVMMMLLCAACCPVEVPWSVECVLPENRHDIMLREPAREVRLEGILRDTKRGQPSLFHGAPVIRVKGVLC